MWRCLLLGSSGGLLLESAGCLSGIVKACGPLTHTWWWYCAEDLLLAPKKLQGKISLVFISVPPFLSLSLFCVRQPCYTPNRLIKRASSHSGTNDTSPSCKKLQGKMSLVLISPLLVLLLCLFFSFLTGNYVKHQTGERVEVVGIEQSIPLSSARHPIPVYT